MRTSSILCALWLCTLAGCGTEPAEQSQLVASEQGSPVSPALDRSCDRASVYSETWLRCEAYSYSLLSQGIEESLTSPNLQAQTFKQRGIQLSRYLEIRRENTSRLSNLLSPSSLATIAATGDPFRHPDSAGPNGASFYSAEGLVENVFFYDRDCTRLDGKIWMPRSNMDEQRRLPAVVINNGSIVGAQPLYYWAAQALVRAGYMVLTFDHRSQGQSDPLSADGQFGANIEPSVYWLNLIDSIDFLRSSPQRPHPYDLTCADGSHTDRFNPFFASLDLQRLGVAGHSFGAAGATFAQSFGDTQDNPWPGKLDEDNPIDAIVTWDALGHPGSPINANGGALTRGIGNLAGPTYSVQNKAYPRITPRVPALDLPSDFGALATPALFGESKTHFLEAFNYWALHGMDAMVIVPHASVHTHYSPNPFLPSSSWCGDPNSDSCATGWVIPIAEHYTVAWFDHWLKLPQEPGYQTALERLLDDENPLTGVANMSWHYTSARQLRDRQGNWVRCVDLRAGCDAP